MDTARCVIVSDDREHLIGTIGVTDLIVVHDGNATLVAHRDAEGDVKKLIDAIKARGLGRYL